MDAGTATGGKVKRMVALPPDLGHLRRTLQKAALNPSAEMALHPVKYHDIALGGQVLTKGTGVVGVGVDLERGMAEASGKVQALLARADYWRSQGLVSAIVVQGVCWWNSVTWCWWFQSKESHLPVWSSRFQAH